MRQPGDTGNVRLCSTIDADMCRGFGLSKGSPEFEDIKEPRCDSWLCEDCSPRRKARLILQIQNGRPEKFLTLTMQRSNSRSAAEACDRMMIAWDRLLKRLRRLHAGKPVEALWVIEKTKLGWPHLHVALRMPFTSQRRLSRWWEELSSARIVDIRQVKSMRQVANYFAKYIGKAPEQFGKHRRYSMTRGWLLAWERVEKHVTKFGEPRWHRIDGPVAEHKHRLVAQAHFPEEISERWWRFWRLGHWPERAGEPP